MPDIVLATQNAKWIHASFGLRYLRANLGPLRDRSVLREFEIGQRPVDVAESILAEQPRIVGLGVYVWNAAAALQLVRTLKAVAPGVRVVLGGPEVSHETERQEICSLADHVVRGEADLAFREVCTKLLAGDAVPHVVDAPLPHFAELASPYDEYTDADIAHRVVYVESSRGCPFTCEFCLSSLDVPVRKVDLVAFLAQMERLLQRGVRHFKFVDRTFNLGIAAANTILRFFRERWQPGLFLHFELIPDRLPAELRAEIAAFPPGALQFEVGVQTLDDATSERISRHQDVGRMADNLRWLRTATGAHVHADLIVGLPGEAEVTFAAGFDRLWAMGPHEIQVGVLKRLRGTPIVRHDAEHGVVWAEEPPYEVLQTAVVPFATMQRMKRFARYWDVVGNSGNWTETLAHVLAGPSAYGAFAAFADWLHAATRATAGIALHRLAALLWRWLVGRRRRPRDGCRLRPLRAPRLAGVPAAVRHRRRRRGRRLVPQPDHGGRCGAAGAPSRRLTRARHFAGVVVAGRPSSARCAASSRGRVTGVPWSNASSNRNAKRSSPCGGGKPGGSAATTSSAGSSAGGSAGGSVDAIASLSTTCNTSRRAGS
jgi:radical SAM superfamily enzyme YgiQ (UPF0313 family)